MKKIFKPSEIVRGSGCYLKMPTNPLKGMPYYNKAELSMTEFMSEKSMPPQDRLWFFINGGDLDDWDKSDLVEVFQETHPKYFKDVKAGFDNYVRKFNKLFYVEKKIKERQVEIIIKKLKEKNNGIKF